MDKETPKKNAGFKHTVKAKFHETHQRTREHTGKLLQTKKGKVLVVIFGVVLVLIILVAIPFTRYAILGTVVKKDVTVTIVDSKTKKPVTEASVTVGGVTAQSDKDGIANLSVPVNDDGIDVTKQYYTSIHESYTVPVFSSPEHVVVELDAQGRQVTVSVTNKITQKPLADVTVDSNGTKAISDTSGIATMILPPEKDSWSAKISHDGYNTATVQLKDDSNDANKVALAPSGSIVYLSKATGKINVMRSNLDGSDAKVIVPATGQESDYGTSLLASRDWRYAVLLSAREADKKQRVYLVDIEKGTFSLIDEGSASFTLVGWSGHNFVYRLYRSVKSWEPRRESFKSYNADSRTLSTLTDTRAVGDEEFYGYESFGNAYLLDDELVYSSTWVQNRIAKKDRVKSALVSVKISTGIERKVKEYSIAASVNLKLYEPRGIYLRIGYESEQVSFQEYEDGGVKSVSNVDDDNFYDAYPTYLVSPSGDKVLWYEERDGKNTLLVGDKDGKNSRILSAGSEYLPYGWYGGDDRYVLLSKNSSELYVADASGSLSQPLKITDYHRARSYSGYGYGYGGL